MAVDEKYIETVKDEPTTNNNEGEQMNFEDFLKSRGETGTGFEKDDVAIPYDYRQFKLQELCKGELYDGRPVLSQIEEMEYGNTEVIRNYAPILLNELGWTYNQVEEVLGHEKAKGFFENYHKISEDTYMELCDKLSIDKLDCYKPYKDLISIKYRLDLYLIDDDNKEVYTIPINLYSNQSMQEVGRNSGLFKLRMGLYELQYPGISLQYKTFNVNIDALRDDINNMDDMTLKIDFVEKKDFKNGGYNTFVVVNPEDY